MRTLKTIGCFIGKWTWNGFIGIILIGLATVYALCVVVGGFVAKIMSCVGMFALGADMLLALISFLFIKVFDSPKDWIELFAAALIAVFVPGFVVGAVSEILKTLTLAVRDNCFID